MASVSPADRREEFASRYGRFITHSGGVVSSAWASPQSSSSSTRSFLLKRSQKDIVLNKSKSSLQSVSVMPTGGAGSPGSTFLLQKSAAVPLDSSVTIYSISPSGKYSVTLRKDSPAPAAPGAAAGTARWLLELQDCSSGSSLSVLHIDPKLHGDIINDGWFSTEGSGGGSWSPDERFFCYVAEGAKPSAGAFWEEYTAGGGAAAAGAASEGKGNGNGSSLKGRQYDWEDMSAAEGDTSSSSAATASAALLGRDSWGEKYEGVRLPRLFIADLFGSTCSSGSSSSPSSSSSSSLSATILAVPGIPSGIAAGQPVWATAPSAPSSTATAGEGATTGGEAPGYCLVYTGWPTEPRRLGLIYCYNRPCRLFAADVSRLLSPPVPAAEHVAAVDAAPAGAVEAGKVVEAQKDGEKEKKEKAAAAAAAVRHVCLTPTPLSYFRKAASSSSSSSSSSESDPAASSSTSVSARGARLSPDGQLLAFLATTEAGLFMHNAASELWCFPHFGQWLQEWLSLGQQEEGEGKKEKKGEAAPLPQPSLLLGAVATPSSPQAFQSLYSHSLSGACWGTVTAPAAAAAAAPSQRAYTLFLNTVHRSTHAVLRLHFQVGSGSAQLLSLEKVQLPLPAPSAAEASPSLAYVSPSAHSLSLLSCSPAPASASAASAASAGRLAAVDELLLCVSSCSRPDRVICMSLPAASEAEKAAAEAVLRTAAGELPLPALTGPFILLHDPVPELSVSSTDAGAAATAAGSQLHQQQLQQEWSLGLGEWLPSSSATASSSTATAATASSGRAITSVHAARTHYLQELAAVQHAVVTILPSHTASNSLPFEALLLFPNKLAAEEAGAAAGGAAAPSSSSSSSSPSPSLPELPLLVVPHGGPHSTFTSDYMLPYAFLAASGYAVLLVNFRGSLGFGESSTCSLPGLAGVQDIEDTWQAVVTCLHLAGAVVPQPPAKGAAVATVPAVAAAPSPSIFPFTLNGSRMAISGGSHGGFITSHMLGQRPWAFKAAAMRNPVTNLPGMASVTDIPDWCVVEAVGIEQSKQHCFLQGVPAPSSLAGAGSEVATAGAGAVAAAAPAAAVAAVPSLALSDPAVTAAMQACSPLRYVRAAAAGPTAVLVLLGMKDRRVPASQGVEYYYALKQLRMVQRAQEQQQQGEKQGEGLNLRMLTYPEDVHAIDRPSSEADAWLNISCWISSNGV